jgi:hypothetical protein
MLRDKRPSSSQSRLRSGDELADGVETGTSRRRYAAALVVCWIASRFFYSFYCGVTFDDGPLSSYLQYIDPSLLESALLQSVFYLRDQPPGFNLFLGLILQFFADRAGLAFHFAYLGFGLGLAIVLYFFLLRIGVLPVLAFTIVCVFSMSPITILYENWLFYTYPIAFLLTIGAFFLHRYITTGRTADGVVFYSSLAIIVLSRGIFHLGWFLLILLPVLARRGTNGRRAIVAAAVPCLVVGAYYCKSYLIFGTLLSGETYREMNLAMMVFDRLPSSVVRTLIAENKISELALLSPYELNDPRTLEREQYRRLLPPIKRWGIPVLDQEIKSTGFTNWQSQVIGEFGRVYGRDAMIAMRRYPKAYLGAVSDNARRYFLPADESWPFFDVKGNRIRELLVAWHIMLAGQSPWTGRVPWFNLLTLPACFLFGCIYVLRWARGDGRESKRPRDADAGVVLFMLYNIAYLAAVTVLFSVSDHNRYRFKVSPFYAALFGLLVTDGVRRFRTVLSGSHRTVDPLNRNRDDRQRIRP